MIMSVIASSWRSSKPQTSAPLVSSKALASDAPSSPSGPRYGLLQRGPWLDGTPSNIANNLKSPPEASVKLKVA
eukprot:CAMPEP_0171510540 /NCGR_PEP_ID=MMETSP0959-20130129/435_1 /TAXON_ID=87120 /ORGANISM="Aurantiochytrium limacinum, Strain ATCCMYA-1381" /LENGTH=73 /DNA_ID=CAMNT_0012047945 /DNA_START=1448 /DNA_END=1669 /DNA_ORIENTATION=+